jgi:hypothetical protein
VRRPWLGVLLSIVVIQGCGTTATASAPTAAVAPIPTATASPTPTPTSEPTPSSEPLPSLPPFVLPASYATLTSEAFAKVVRAPKDHIGEGYKLWGCILQLSDPANGFDSFVALASYRNEGDWTEHGSAAYFLGEEALITDFALKDRVVMKVVAAGASPYVTRSGGTSEAPLFYVVNIQLLKGSCS